MPYKKSEKQRQVIVYHPESWEDNFDQFIKQYAANYGIPAKKSVVFNHLAHAAAMSLGIDLAFDYPVDQARVAKNLYVLRDEAKLTQEKMGELFGVRGIQWNVWENANAIPRHETLDEIASLFQFKSGQKLTRQDILSENLSRRAPDIRFVGQPVGN